jgi:Spy/CpxP family protein refolding chaperone
MKLLTKTLLASAAILAVASLPVLAAGPGGGFGGGPGGCPGYSQQIVTEKLKLTDAQKKAYEEYQKVATAEREAHWKLRDSMDPKAIHAMTPEQFREHQTEMMKSRIDSQAKVFEARQKFTATLSDEQKKLLDDGFGFGPGRGPGPGHRGGGWMM